MARESKTERAEERRSAGWLIAGILNVLPAVLTLLGAIVNLTEPRGADGVDWYTLLGMSPGLLMTVGSTITCFLLYKRKHTRGAVVNETIFAAAMLVIAACMPILASTESAREAKILDPFRVIGLCAFFFGSAIAYIWKAVVLYLLYKDRGERALRITCGVFWVAAMLMMIAATAADAKECRDGYEVSCFAVAVLAAACSCIPLLMGRKYGSRFWGVMAVAAIVLSLRCLIITTYIGMSQTCIFHTGKPFRCDPEVLREQIFLPILHSVCRMRDVVPEIDTSASKVNDFLLSVLLFADPIPLVAATPFVCLGKKRL